MSEGKCGEGRGEIGVREGKEGGREVSGRERRKREEEGGTGDITAIAV